LTSFWQILALELKAERRSRYDSYNHLPLGIRACLGSDYWACDFLGQAEIFELEFAVW
jgi:hypothetical protein